ncbi:MAG TPA: hypothetical protein VIQ51_08645 [Chryseosolibacter sp.]
MSFQSKISILFILGFVLAIAMLNIPLAIVALFGLACNESVKGYAFLTPNIDLVGACERISEEMETLAGENYAYNLKRKTGALDFITSPENGGVDAKLISYQEGKKLAKLHVLYDQRTKPCQISDDADSTVCDAGSEPVRKEATITISNHIKTPVRAYSNQDMAALCKDTQAFIRSRALSDFRAAHEFFSEKILAVLDNNIGANKEWDGSTTAAGAYKPIQLLATESGQRIPKPGNFAEMIEDYMNNQLNGTPAIIGQGNFAMFAKLHKMSCCNATTPYGDENLDSEARFYLDQAANTVLGASKVILAGYKAVQLLTFNENRNINLVDKTQAHIVVPDPLGYPFDWNLDFYFDKCDKVWKTQYSLLWGTFSTFQSDSFAADGEGDSPDTSPDCADELDGLTGIFGYEVTAA